MKELLDGGENVIKPAKIPNKAFGMRYKVKLKFLKLMYNHKKLVTTNE